MKRIITILLVFGFLSAACSGGSSESSGGTTTVSGVLTEDQTWSGEVLGRRFY